MNQYEAPLADFSFLLFDVMQAHQTYSGLAGYEEFSPDLAEAVLSEMAKFASGVLLPANALLTIRAQPQGPTGGSRSSNCHAPLMMQIHADDTVPLEPSPA